MIQVHWIEIVRTGLGGSTPRRTQRSILGRLTSRLAPRNYDAGIGSRIEWELASAIFLGRVMICAKPWTPPDVYRHEPVPRR
jgi:hypothetical protein